MPDVTMHASEVFPLGVDFAPELAKLTAAKGSTVSLSGTPGVTIEDEDGNDVTSDWGDPTATKNNERVDLLLDPPAGTSGDFEVTVECDHDGYSGGHLVGLVRDARTGVIRVFEIRVVS